METKQCSTIRILTYFVGILILTIIVILIFNPRKVTVTEYRNRNITINSIQEVPIYINKTIQSICPNKTAQAKAQANLALIIQIKRCERRLEELTNLSVDYEELNISRKQLTSCSNELCEYNSSWC